MAIYNIMSLILCITTAVVIGFRSPFQTVMEGETINVCVVVKPQGLILDPFDRVPLSLRMKPG